MKIKIIFFCLVLLFSGKFFAQENIKLLQKIKQHNNQKQFYKNIFQNPALMQGFGTRQFSRLKATYSNAANEMYTIQKPRKESGFKISASSFYPIDSTKTVWGKASYSNVEEKNKVWNEAIDYDLIYPYITADSVGGNLSNERYHFLGGYAKTTKKIDFGTQLQYKANLASRSRDPRVKDVSSNFQIKSGVYFKDLFGVDLGLHAGFQKYTQSNDIRFFNQISVPEIYHLNGLGYFNDIVRGTYKSVFYDGSGFNLGMQLQPIKNNDLWLYVNTKQLKISKFLSEAVSTELSSLKSNDINASLVKLFTKKGQTFGVKLMYQVQEKKGLESILSSRTGSTLKIIGQNENYKLNNTTYQLSTLYYKDAEKYFMYFSPYINYQKYKEDYFLIRSYQYVDNLNVGFVSRYTTSVNEKILFSAVVNFNYKAVLKGKSLLRNDNQVSISNMLHQNNELLNSNYINSGVKLKLDYSVAEKINVFVGINTETALVNTAINNLYTISTGVSF
ncbi:hypothetical protein KUL113_19430 [Tenacibaculum sp. KUL113]|nr:hypothetical protein KUL113_19430 [Tenacibaculum sp. KUL113]